MNSNKTIHLLPSVLAALLTSGVVATSAVAPASASSGANVVDLRVGNAATASNRSSRAASVRRIVGFLGAAPAYRWIPSSGGKRWTNEVVAGTEGRNRLVVCRADHKGGKHPGKVVAGKCNFGYGGREIQGRSYEVLVATMNPRWSGAAGAVPAGAFVAARYDGRNGYVCRGTYRGVKHPGKTVAGNCNIGYGGKEVLLRNYETLMDVPAQPVVKHTPKPAPPRGSGGLTWVNPSASAARTSAVKGGREGSRTLVVCRANYRGGRHPGKLVAGRCNFGFGGREVQSPDYQVLVAVRGSKPAWSRRTTGLSANAFPAATYDGRLGYVCRAAHRGGVHPGKVVANKCNIGYGGKEIMIPQFETLLAPGAAVTQVPPPAPAVIAPLVVKPTPVAQAPSCADALQGKIAWDTKGSTRWNPRNIAAICNGGRGDEPARCFAKVMHGNVNWGGGTVWKWENARDLCAGSRNGNATVACFKQKLGRGKGWKKAINRCKAR